MSVSDFLQECEIKCMKKNIEKSLDFWKSLQGVCFCVRKRKISRKKSLKHTPEALQVNIRNIPNFDELRRVMAFFGYVHFLLN